MVNTKSLILGFGLALSASAMPVEQQQHADCHSKSMASGSATAKASVPAVTASVIATSAPAIKTTAIASSVVAKPTQAPAAPVASVLPSAAPAAPAAAKPAAGLTAEQLIAIAPLSANCDKEAAVGECAPASRAAPAIAASFEKYGIDTPGAQAALIAIMMFETESFKYSKNHFPGRPGQGTRNMQMANFNKLYAADLKGAAAANVADADVLGLLSDDNASFGSAAWYLTKQCDASIKKGLADGSMTGWDTYLTKCINTTHAPERDTAWTAAKKVLKI